MCVFFCFVQLVQGPAACCPRLRLAGPSHATSLSRPPHLHTQPQGRVHPRARVSTPSSWIVTHLEHEPGMQRFLDSWSVCVPTTYVA